MENKIDHLIQNYLGTSFYSYLVVTLLIFAIAILLHIIIKKSMTRFLDRSHEILKSDKTKYKFIKNAVGAIIYLVALFLVTYTIPPLRSVAYTLFAGAGIAAAVLAFASQAAFSNIIGGVFIVIFKPFRVGDNVKIGNNYAGIIEDITLRHTVIRNFENRMIIIPNSKISSDTVLNSTIEDPHICNFIEFRISYNSSIDKAMEIIKEEAEAHEYIVDHRSEEAIEKNDPIVMCRVIELAEFAVVIRAYVWSDNPGHAWVLKCDMLKSVKERFEREGIEIPYPYRNIIQK